MSDLPTTCPECSSTEIHFRKSRGDWACDNCEHKWAPTAPANSSPPPAPRARLFLSYGRRDAQELADRLEQDLSLFSYEVWRDTRKIRSGTDFLGEIEDGLRSTQLVVALLSPHAVREAGDPNSPDDLASVCLDELHLARFSCKVPIVPVMAVSCRPPFVIFRLDYVEMLRWHDFGEAYQRGFRKLLEAIETVRTNPQKVWRYRRWDERLQPFDFADFLFTKRRDFCGREWLFEAIEQWRTEPDRQRALLITGDPGIGKSAIVAQLIHANPGGQVLAHHCCQFLSRETLRPGRFIRSLAAQLASQIEGYAGQLDDPKVEAALNEGRCLDDPFSAFEEGILGPLHALHAPPGGVRYLLIDALDEALAHREGPSLVDLLASRLDRLPGWLRLVATARKDPDVLRRLSGLRAEEIKADDPRNLDDVERLLAHRLRQPALRARLDRSRISPEAAISRLRQKSEGNFLWVQQALLGLESDSYDFDHLEALPPGLTGLYGAFFERHFPDEATYAPVRRVLEVVAAALEPLSAAELGAAIGLDPDYELSTLLDRLAAYLPERGGQRAIYHKSFSDWLTETKEPRPAGRFFVSPRRGHERLADWCWSDYQRDPRRLSPYALRHLPVHLMAAARHDDLANLLRDLSYLEAKAEAGLVFDLAMDFTRAWERIPIDHSANRHLRLIEQALRSDLHFLARRPTTLFQCLWNRCWWYDCPEAAAHYDPPTSGWPAEGPPWSRLAPERLSTLLEAWHDAKERRSPGFVWLRSLRPPDLALGSPQLACLRGHAGPVLSVAYSPDSRLIVSGSYDKTVQVWDAESGLELASLRGHAEKVNSVAYSPDGHRIVSGSEDQTVRMWDAASGAELACVRGRLSQVDSVAYSPDGRRLVTAAYMVQVWDAETGAGLAHFYGRGHPLYSATYSPDGRRIVTGSIDGMVRVWDADSGAELACLRGHEASVESVAYSPDGRCIVSGSNDQTVRIWDADSGVEMACLRGHTDRVNNVAYSPDGRRIVSGSEDHTVRVWDAESHVELACLRGHTGGIHGVAYSPDGRRIVTGAWDQTVRVWDPVGGVEPPYLRDHEGWVQSVTYSPDGRRIVSGSKDQTVRVWDVESGAELACLPGHSEDVTSVAYSPNGHHVVVGSWDQTVRVWDAESGAELACFRGHTGGVYSVAYSPDGRHIASGGDETVRVWEADTGVELACFRHHEEKVYSVAYSPDGRHIVSGCDDTVRVWDADSGVEMTCLRGHADKVWSVMYSPDGQTAHRQLVEGLDSACLGCGQWGIARSDRGFRRCHGNRGGGKRFSMAGVEREVGNGHRTGGWWRGHRLVPGRVGRPERDRDSFLRTYLGRVGGQPSLPDPA